MKRSGAGRPVSGAFLSVDRPPRKGGALQPEPLGAVLGQWEGHPPPVQCVCRRTRIGVTEDRQDVTLGVPEDVPVVAGTGQPLGGDGPLLRAGAGLQHVEEPEADRLLYLRVTVDLDVRAGPELVEEGALLTYQ